MAKRLRTIGLILALFGVGFVVAGGVAFVQIQNGYGSLQAFSEAQNVTLSYDDDGNLTDRGTTEGAEAIMTLLQEDWGYPVNMAHFDPADPLVNTSSEYMYQMATIGYHVLHGTQTVVLDEAVEYNGVTYEAGAHEVVVNEVGSEERVAAGLGGYWTDFDRLHPLEGPARAQAWSGTAHGLFGELGVGTVTASTLQLGLALAGGFAAFGLAMIAAGLGLWWASKGTERVRPIEVSAAEMPKKQVRTS